MSAAAPLIAYLEQLQDKGETHIALDEHSRAILRKFYVRAVKGATEVVDRVPQQAAPVANVTRTSKTLSNSPAQPAAGSTQAPVAVKPRKATGATHGELLDSLRSICESYAPLKALGSLRTCLVFPTPASSSDIMFVGEAPGYHDEKNGFPFSGPAGEKLNGILRAMGLRREQVHVTNILKFRPAIPQQTTNGRPATAIELETAKPLMDQEINTLKPKLIITLGDGAAKFFTKSTEDIDTLRSGSHSYKGIPVLPTYHPSYLLQAGETEDKRRLWLDMLKVMEMLSMPISEKQQGYFKKK